ncbi:holo-ACP synthase [Microlunatus aurantiacus]|uniref:holo-ACP synthase n=1 Tax=Microlunatus aurantiacus TaxID=446786 RepID=UPI0031DD5DAC
MGVDVTDVRRISRLIERRGSRFIHRWFTTEEVAECGVSESPTVAFAVRFAAKEAVWKSIRIDWDGSVPWRSISILGADAAPTVKLGDEVAAAARDLGVSAISIAVVVHEYRAMAVAICEEGRSIPT